MPQTLEMLKVADAIRYLYYEAPKCSGMKTPIEVEEEWSTPLQTTPAVDFQDSSTMASPRFAVAYRTAPNCTDCGASLPSYITACHRVLVGDGPEEYMLVVLPGRTIVSRDHLS